MQISLYAKKMVSNKLLTKAAQSGDGCFDGKQCKNLEKMLSIAIGVNSVRATSSVINAYRNLLYAWSIGRNEAVFVPSFTAPLIINTAVECGATVIMVDCDDETWHMSADRLREAVKKCLAQGKIYPRAVVVSDIFGTPFDVDAISEVCNEYGLLLIEDAYLALGGSYKGRMSGSLGDAAITSLEPPFFPYGFCRCGMIMTNDMQLSKVIRLVCGGGFKTFSSATGAREIVRIGEYSSLDELAAALIFEGLQDRIERVMKRRINAAKIRKAVEDCNVKTQKLQAFAESAYPFIPIRAVNREEAVRMVSELRQNGIESSAFYSKPFCRNAAIKFLDYHENMLPVGSDLSVSLFAVPCNESLTEKEVKFVCDTLHRVCR